MADFRLFLPDDAGGVMGEVDEKGVLTFVISATAESPIRGTELFDLMVRAFGQYKGCGAEVFKAPPA